MNRTVTLLDIGDGRLAALAPYSAEFVDKMKSELRASWNPKAVRWEFPRSREGAFRSAFGAWIVLGSNIGDDSSRPKSDRESLAAIEAAMDVSLCALKYSRRTIERYLAIVERYAEYIGKPLPESSNFDATRFIAHLERDKGSSASTINQAISAIRFLYGRVLGLEVVLGRRPKADRRLPGILSYEEVSRILAAPKSVKHRALLAIAYSAGLRVSEIAAMRKSDVDFDREVILVRRGKGRKDRYTLLAEKLKRLLLSYIEECKPEFWLFEGSGGGHITIRSIQEVFYKAKEKAGVHKALGIHSLRHSFATHLLENGTDIRYIQELLGHANPTTTQIYTHIAKKDLLRIRSPYDRGGGDA